MSAGRTHRGSRVLLLLCLAGASCAGLALVAVSLMSFDGALNRMARLVRNPSLLTVDVFAGVILRARVAGIAMLVSAIIGMLFLSRLERCVADILEAYAEFAGDVKKFATGLWREDVTSRSVLLLLIVSAIAVRIAFLFQPMSCDESYTFTRYASKPIYFCMAHYSGANNHLFHTLFVHLSTRLLGSAPWAIRLPALLAGILLVPVAYATARAFWGRQSALLTAGLIASSSILIDFSVNARGYSMLFTIFLLMLLLARYLLMHSNLFGWAILAVLSALGLFTIPTMLYGYGTVMGWLLLSRRALRSTKSDGNWWRGFLLSAAIAVIITGMLYLPAFVGSGANPMAGQPDEIKPGTLIGLLAGLSSMFAAVWNQWNRDLPLALQAVLAVGFIASQVVAFRQIRNRGLPLVIPAVLWCMPLVFAVRMVPYPRVWLLFLPVYLGLASAGLLSIARAVVKRPLPHAAMLLGAVVLCGSGWLQAQVVLERAAYCREERWPLPDAEEVTAYLRDNLREGDRVYGHRATLCILEYYFGENEMDTSHIYATPQNARRVIVLLRTDIETLDSTLSYLSKQQPDLSLQGDGRLLRTFPKAALYEFVASDE